MSIDDPAKRLEQLQFHLQAIRHGLTKMDEEMAKLQRRRALMEYHLQRLEFEIGPQRNDGMAFFVSIRRADKLVEPTK